MNINKIQIIYIDKFYLIMSNENYFEYGQKKIILYFIVIL